MRLTIQFLCGILCFHFNICLCNYLFNTSHQLLSENETLITILAPPMNRKLKCTLSYTKASTKSHYAISMYTINSTFLPGLWIQFIFDMDPLRIRIRGSSSDDYGSGSGSESGSGSGSSSGSEVTLTL